MKDNLFKTIYCKQRIAMVKKMSLKDFKQYILNEAKKVYESVLLNEEDHVSDDPSFNYRLLSRLQSDCEYYLGFGNKSEKHSHLWAGSVDAQIDKMKELWNNLSPKPEWLSMEDILEYERKMKRETVSSDIS